MTKIKPIYNTNEAFTKTEQTTENTNENNLKQTEIHDDTNHEFFISKDYKDFVKQFSKLELDKQYTTVSFGNWSLKHVVFHILSLTGKAEIFSTTYGLGPGAARGIVTGIKSGMISNFNFLYDNKIKTYKQEAHNLCISNFPVKIASIHAKVTVIINESWGITISGSANWSDSNNKIETMTISTNKALALFHKDWIYKAMQTKSANPEEILKEINSKK